MRTSPRPARPWPPASSAHSPAMPRLRRFLRSAPVALIAAVLLASCTGTPRDPAEAQREVQARGEARDQRLLALAQGIDDRLAAAKTLPPAERYAFKRGLRDDLQHFLDESRGSRHENKALYYLADWQFEHGPAERISLVEALLDRLQQKEYPAFQGNGEDLRVLVRLRQGRASDARAIAVRRAQAVPESRWLVDLCDFHARIGKPAGRTQGKGLVGPDDPVAQPGPWQLWIFAGNVDEDLIFLVGRYLDAIARAGLRDRVQVVLAAAAAQPLRAASLFNGLPSGHGANLVWIDANEAETWKAWRTSWGWPVLPCNALLGAGPDRRILAVQVTPEELGSLIGERK